MHKYLHSHKHTAPLHPDHGELTAEGEDSGISHGAVESNFPEAGHKSLLLCTGTNKYAATDPKSLLWTRVCFGPFCLKHSSSVCSYWLFHGLLAHSRHLSEGHFLFPRADLAPSLWEGNSVGICPLPAELSMAQTKRN